MSLKSEGCCQGGCPTVPDPPIARLSSDVGYTVDRRKRQRVEVSDYCIAGGLCGNVEKVDIET